MQLCVLKTKDIALKKDTVEKMSFGNSLYHPLKRRKGYSSLYYCDNSVSSDKIQIIYPLFRPKILRNKMCHGGAAK